jgi:hypothetical protein
MNIVTLLIILSLSFGEVFAQNQANSISGTVSDLETHESLAYASIVLIKPNVQDSISFVASTDTLGRFIIRNVTRGTYRLRISCMAYRPFETSLFTIFRDSSKTFDLFLDPYYGFTAEQAHQDIKKGIIRIYVWGNIISYSKAHENLAQQYGFKIGVAGCDPLFRTDKYDSVMIQYLASRNGRDWFQRFLKEWNKIKWP